ncbi:MAG: nucleotidyltransferase [Candidatus Desulfovibrio kirbyi]|jgi:predicted nucleotidyltransferase|uniref:Nucleotidyltransferase n=1 Tax=Candidatus Desulfovibrio kirbyi TaxID=2696086 RepID=A0A6L2R6E8_9BACT|nr:MAG: nucleotidyltransferase [Candidatus Desulfovibrio kirbyi]
MSVLTYLTSIAGNAILSSNEISSIDTSINTLKSRINLSFINGTIKNQILFGSSTRGTILPRTMDENSDIDYMVVFKDDSYMPQTYLGWLKRFIEHYYSRSEIYQSSPSVVLELNHIKFDIVPAIITSSGELQIPDKSNGWMTTNPNDFNTTLESANVANHSLIKPTIRLMKYWNAQSNYPFNSFELEKIICAMSFLFQNNQKDYLFNAIENFNAPFWNNPQWVLDEIARAQKIVSNVRCYEKNMPAQAESEIKKLFRL